MALERWKTTLVLVNGFSPWTVVHQPCRAVSSEGHVTASLLQLHWLLVRWRVQFKLCCLMHSVFYGKCPDYLANVMSPVDCGVHIAVFDLYHHRISVCRSYAPSLASMPSHMPARLHGTHYRRTYVLSLILDFLENDSRHFFSLDFCVC